MNQSATLMHDRVAAPEEVTSELPLQLTRLIGREHEIATVRQELDTGPEEETTALYERLRNAEPV